MGDLRAAPVVGPSGRGSAPPSRPNDLNSTTKITHSIFFYPSVSTFTSAALRMVDTFGGEPRECERNESVAEGQSGHTFMLCFTSLRQTRRQDGNYFSCCGRRSRLSSSSWVWSILDGASIITSRPWLFFGKAMKSRMDSLPANSVQTRSKPNARPP